MPDIHGKLIEAAGPLPYECVVVKLLFNEDIAYAECQSAVSARANRYPFGSVKPGCHRSSRIYYNHLCATLLRRYDPFEVERRAVRSRVSSPDYNQLRIFDIRKHIDKHPAHRDVRCYHGKGDVAERTCTQGVGRTEGKEHARC